MARMRRREDGDDELRRRTREFGLRAMDLAEALPLGPAARVIQGQLIRCSSSVGANYRAAKRAKSNADFISKMGTVEEEADESMFWMEMIVDKGLMKESLIADLYNEADEILSMVIASIKTAKSRK